MIDIYKNKLHISARSMKGEVKESRIVYKSKWLEVYEDLLSVNEIEKKGKKNGDYTNNIKLFNKIKTKNDGATIVPVFSDGSLLMIESYRRGVDAVILELPGGLVENNEKPIETARKELLQETGYSCEILESKGWFYTWPSRSNQKVHVFIAKGLDKVSKQKLDATENIKLKIISKDEISLKLKNQEIRSAETISALFYGYLMSRFE
jgi:ADP-ribose pyrophosphatase